MKPEELARYERMYRVMQQLLRTKLLRFHFSRLRSRPDPDRSHALIDERGRGDGRHL